MFECSIPKLRDFANAVKTDGKKNYLLVEVKLSNNINEDRKKFHLELVFDVMQPKSGASLRKKVEIHFKTDTYASFVKWV
jgi:hypothetical protein